MFVCHLFRKNCDTQQKRFYSELKNAACKQTYWNQLTFSEKKEQFSHLISEKISISGGEYLWLVGTS